MILLFLKGLAMGAANVIPGVSGGTIAFITGIYEKFIDSLKSFDILAIKLLLRFDLKGFAKHINFNFLLILGLGILVSLFSLGKLLDYLFVEFPIYVWAFFFGLIAVSVYSMGKTIDRWDSRSIASFILGTALAITLALLKPAAENSGLVYLVLCGVVAMASMILPGLSGSFVLILMGNYQLIMLKAVPGFQLDILLPVIAGSILGFVILSRVISYFITKHRDSTLSILTGFILGSLLIIWPWKSELLMLDELGSVVLKDDVPIVSGYSWSTPPLTFETVVATILMLSGVIIVIAIERIAKTREA